MTINWPAAAGATVIAGALLTAWSTWDQVLPGTGRIVATTLALDVGLAAVLGAVVALVVWLAGRRRHGRFALYIWMAVATAGMLVTLPAGAAPLLWFAAVAIVLAAGPHRILGFRPELLPGAGPGVGALGITRPAPLVLLVHGNISTVADSETGLSYLGSQLAGHGFVAAAIDENFLNTGPWDRSGGLGGIDEARARMILAHLDQWRQWAGDLGSVFHRVIDTDHIGLVGHSRGGEAIAVATQLNAEEHLGHAIETLVALAPIDGQYRPGGPGVVLDGVDYLVLQGAQDADVIRYGGLDQLARVSGRAGDEPWIAGAAVAEGLDHSGFNAAWPGPDIGYGLPQVFLDRGRLNPAVEQRSFAAGWVTSVMTAGLRADAGSRANFVAGALEAGRRAGDGAAHLRGAAPGRAPGRRGCRAGTHHRHLRTR